MYSVCTRLNCLWVPIRVFIPLFGSIIVWVLQRSCLKAASYLDGEVIPHVFPDPEATHVAHPAASTRGSVTVEEPPNAVQHADQPEASEQQVKEQKDAGGRWGKKEVLQIKPVYGQL